MNKKLILLPLLMMAKTAFAAPLTVEEQRIEKAQVKIPSVLDIFSEKVHRFDLAWQKVENFQRAKAFIQDEAHQLWLDSKAQVRNSKLGDDRVLYWTRLKLSRVIRSQQPGFALTDAQQKVLLELLEFGSRGRNDLDYNKGAQKKILLTGFDPFLLDRNINQSNPSGLAALTLDGQTIEMNGITAEINTVMIPVRYEDFDQGLIESLLAPFYALDDVDMIVTVSMGRKEFDLERFPGKRRSVTAPDNANLLSGGDAANPVIPKLNGRPLPGREFVEFSLPVKFMQQAKGPYKVIDNHKITDLEASYEARSLVQLSDKVAVKGGGGGYLSNEISYRSIRLRNELNSSIPTGHIHTPRIQQYEPEIEAKIVQQVKGMLEQSIVAL